MQTTMFGNLRVTLVAGISGAAVACIFSFAFFHFWREACCYANYDLKLQEVVQLTAALKEALDVAQRSQEKCMRDKAFKSRSRNKRGVHENPTAAEIAKSKVRRHKRKSRRKRKGCRTAAIQGFGSDNPTSPQDPFGFPDNIERLRILGMINQWMWPTPRTQCQHQSFKTSIPNGTIEITTSGLYYAFAQVQYLPAGANEMPKMGEALHVQHCIFTGRKITEVGNCLVCASTTFPADKTEYTGGVFKLKKGNKIWIRLNFTDTPKKNIWPVVSMEEKYSLFGVFKV